LLARSSNSGTPQRSEFDARLSCDIASSKGSAVTSSRCGRGRSIAPIQEDQDRRNRGDCTHRKGREPRSVPVLPTIPVSMISAEEMAAGQRDIVKSYNRSSSRSGETVRSALPSVLSDRPRRNQPRCQLLQHSLKGGNPVAPAELPQGCWPPSRGGREECG
jgi:hypothetical protein